MPSYIGTFTATSVITLKSICDHDLPLLCLTFLSSPPVVIGHPPNTLIRLHTLAFAYPKVPFASLSYSHSPNLPQIFSRAILNNLTLSECYTILLPTLLGHHWTWCILLQCKYHPVADFYLSLSLPSS